MINDQIIAANGIISIGFHNAGIGSPHITIAVVYVDQIQGIMATVIFPAADNGRIVNRPDEAAGAKLVNESTDTKLAAMIAMGIDEQAARLALGI